MVYKSNINSFIINDSTVIDVSKGDLLYNGNFHYSISFCINNKSHSIISIDKISCKMTSIYKNIATSYMCNYLSDSVVNANSEKKVYMEFKFNEKDTLITSDYLANRKNLKKNHQFLMDLNLIIGDSIVSKEIIFKPE
jgi:hypothetical protein